MTRQRALHESAETRPDECLAVPPARDDGSRVGAEIEIVDLTGSSERRKGELTSRRIPDAYKDVRFGATGGRDQAAVVTEARCVDKRPVVEPQVEPLAGHVEHTREPVAADRQQPLAVRAEGHGLNAASRARGVLERDEREPAGHTPDACSPVRATACEQLSVR